MREFESAVVAVGKAASFGTMAESPKVRVWGVFVLCFIFSAIGVGASFWAFGATVTGSRLWGLGVVVAVIMLGISYGAKYANEEAREVFTPVDLIQYLSQGFLWPSTWPAMAERLGVEVLAPPNDAQSLLHLGCDIVTTLFV